MLFLNTVLVILGLLPLHINFIIALLEELEKRWQNKKAWQKPTPTHTPSNQLQQIQLNPKMTCGLQNRWPTPGEEEKTTQKRLKWQSHDTAGPYPFFHPSSQEGGRRTEWGGDRHQQTLHSWPWSSTLRTWVHSALGSGD